MIEITSSHSPWSMGENKRKKITKSFSYDEIDKILRLKPMYVLLCPKWWGFRESRQHFFFSSWELPSDSEIPIHPSGGCSTGPPTMPETQSAFRKHMQNCLAEFHCPPMSTHKAQIYLKNLSNIFNMTSTLLKTSILSICGHLLPRVTQITYYKGWEIVGSLGKIFRAKFINKLQIKTSLLSLDLRKTKEDLSENALPKGVMIPIYMKYQWIYL